MSQATSVRLSGATANQIEDPLAVGTRRFRHVLVWATVGAAFLAFGAYMMIRWFFSDDFEQTPHGPTPLPTHMRWAINIGQPLGLALFLYCAWRFVIKPWKRDGLLSFDGMFMLGGISFFLFDAIAGYFQPYFMYNSYLLNHGNWFGFFPGWHQPNAGQYAETPLFAGTWYVYGILLIAIWGCKIMGGIRARFPRLGNFGLVMTMYAIWIVVDFVLEILCILAGFYVYPGAIEGLTLFHGHYYQFPIYEGLLWSGCWTGLTCVRFFRDDKGRTIADRGVDDLKVGAKRKNGIQLLALIGLMQTIFWTYNIFVAVINASSSEWPADIQNRSYFTNMLCGPGTEYACWGPDIPLNHRHSIHIAPDGEAVVPPGVTVP
jgi:hypothetical protein